MTGRCPLLKMLRDDVGFGAFSEPTLVALADVSKSRLLERGTPLFHEGDDSDALYGIQSGCIELGVQDVDGRQISLERLGPGCLFGEFGMLDGQPRTSAAVARDRTEIAFVSRRDFFGLMARVPAVALETVELLCARMRLFEASAVAASGSSVASRIARRLLDLAAVGAGSILLSQEQLSAMVGSSRESVNRHLKAWERDGMVKVTRGRVVLLDRERLAGLASAGLVARRPSAANPSVPSPLC